ncbi:AfsR/SARP family transcriptional regulator [Intrasporangium sp. YIM S08009]|uniref:AfsR/SARP family transcriptional regulator n=1 Tax=Intrasporangium zincisolvens TaxID=3080018 RepID=UPI002B06199C|nr:BTAD domain-containing putative transcriptional regulator [Intrasporangium sp. YIM S08009]
MTGVRFRLLGTVELEVDGVAVRPGGPKQRGLLATLLLNANHRVPIQRVIEALWTDPPASARANVRTYAAALRRHVGERLVARDGGYTLAVGPGELDLDAFRALVRSAEANADRLDSAAARDDLDAALALWHEEALTDHASDLPVDRQLRAIGDERLPAVEAHLEARFALGELTTLLPDLRAFVAEHPTRERMSALLMRVLYRAGDVAAALAAYRGAVQAQADELGLEPSPELRELHRQMLTRDPGLRPDQPAVSVSPAPAVSLSPVPAQLPRRDRHFTGRVAELALLDGMLDGREPSPVALVVGPPGAGKTALAVEWAHSVRDLFPDGQVHLDLHGYAEGGPMAPLAAVTEVLVAFGTGPGAVPKDLDRAAASLRSLLDGKRCLIVLDDARDARQVLPVLPASRGTVVVVTGRGRLTGVVADAATQVVDLGPLADTDSMELLTRLVGPRIADDSTAADSIRRSCSGLPLALRLVAANLMVNATDSLAEHAERLRRQPWLELSTDDGDQPVATAFTQSYDGLDEACRTLFAHLGALPCRTFTHASAAALVLDHPAVTDVERALVDLTNAHLVVTLGRGRFTLHDLLRVFAEDLGRRLGADAAVAAAHRVADWYVATTRLAMGAHTPGERDVLLPVGPRALDVVERVGAPEFPSRSEALGWLEAERGNLLSLVHRPVTGGDEAVSVLLSDHLYRYLDQAGHWHDAAAVHAAAASAAVADPQRLSALGRLGIAQLRLGETDAAVRTATEVAELSERSGDRVRLGRALANLGTSRYYARDLEGALEAAQRGLRVQEECGDAYGLAATNNTLAQILLQLDRHAESVERAEAALGHARAHGNRASECAALGNLGVALLRSGATDRARPALEDTLALAHDLESSVHVVEALLDLSELETVTGAPAEGLRHADAAAALAREIADVRAATRADLRAGQALVALDDLDRAVERLEDACLRAETVEDQDADRARRLLDAVRARPVAPSLTG